MFDFSQVPIEPNEKKILLVIMDGLGGLPYREKTELEAAFIPNLDRLAKSSALGMLVPIAHGVTPGSGAAHLAIFGYDPMKYRVGRGVIEALGVGLVPEPGEVCVRGNFATINKDGVITDRRAKDGEKRMATEECEELCIKLQNAISEIEDVKVKVKHGKNHRFVVVFSGSNLNDRITNSDPGKEGEKPLAVKALLVPEAERTARIVNRFIQLSAQELSGRERANYVLLRGFSLLPKLPLFPERYKLRSAGVASYPMYKGLARLLGMEVLECGESWDEEVAVVEKNKERFDFFFLHFKEFDQAGEDGNFERKVELLEEFDEQVVPRLVRMGFDVLCITGDHSTPALLHSHTWHPVPLLINAPTARSTEKLEDFGESACQRGSLGFILGVELMPLLLAHAQKLGKFGA